MDRRRFVVVGGGLAAQRAAETLRAEGFDGSLTLLCAESEPPYDRPPLSKEFLQAEALPAERLRLQPEAWYRDNDVDLRLDAAAIGLDGPARRVSLAGGGGLEYDALLIATGAQARRLALPGADLEGIHYLRTHAEAERIRQAMACGGRVAVVGAGFIGAEVAACCRQRGLEVTLIEPLPVPLGRALGEEVGRLLSDVHRDEGVDLHTGEAVTAFAGHGRVEAVVGASGRSYPCDFAVVGVGVVPATAWLEASGVPCADGVVVDELCRTGAEGVFAAGDVARWPYRPTGEMLRVEHWDNAVAQGAAAARAMLGQGRPYDPVPYFWSDQYGLRLQYVGHAGAWDRTVYRGDVAGRDFTVFYLSEDRLLAALAVNRPRETMATRRMIGAGIHPQARQLADESVDLRKLARG